MAERKTIIAFGEVLWDLLPSGAVLGGATLNFAYRASSLGDRGLVVSRLGNDDLGKKAFAAMKALGMETAYLQWDREHRTGTVRVELDESGDPDFLILQDVAYDYTEATEGALKLAAAADCFYFGTLSQRRHESRQTCCKLLKAAKRARKFLDINLRKDCYSPETVITSLQAADILKLNEQELLALSDMLSLSGSLDAIAAELVKRYQLQCCVVSLGEQGALAVSNQERAYAPGYQVKVADTVGAGDAFAAGFLHQYLRSASLYQCCDYGNAVGALVAAQTGGTSPLQAQEVFQFLSTAGERNSRPALVGFIPK